MKNVFRPIAAPLLSRVAERARSGSPHEVPKPSFRRSINFDEYKEMISSGSCGMVNGMVQAGSFRELTHTLTYPRASLQG